ncbi:MAG: TIGR02300 family protein [Acetobacteraceae bacterium]
MAKPELGLKRVCVACGAKFYDLMRNPAVCPKCGTEQPAEQPRFKRAPLPADDKTKKRAAPPAADGDDIEIEDVDADAVVEDAEDIEDEDDALGEEIEVETERDEET